MEKQLEFLENKQMREELISKVDVLDKVKSLILLPNTEYATVKQVAEYYEVPERTLSDCITENKDELLSDGCRAYKYKEVLEILNTDNPYLENNKIPNRGLRLLTKRAILRVGMLLRDSEVAKEMRSRLLDIVHDVETGKDNIIENIVDEISEEKQLMMQRVEAEVNGDFDEVSIINAKLFALKNKRIKELEDQVDTITTHALDIVQSRDVINKLMRTIATKEFNGLFGKAFSELYSKINYQLHINIKSRSKKKSESYLDTLSEEEMFATEEIVRAWANNCGIDVNNTLSLRTA